MSDISNLYYTPKLSTSLGGVRRLSNGQKSGQRIKAANALKWLRGQDAYTLHKPVRTKFNRRKTIVSGIGQQAQTDLIDVARYKHQNDGICYLLTAIDVFSKRAWAIPIQTKSGVNVSSALQSILRETRFQTTQSDKSREYLNVTVQSMLKDMGVTHFTSENENIKASVVERFNRTLQTTMHRWMTHTNSERYLDVLDEIITGYNSSYHSSIGMSPNDVNEQNQEDVWLRLYPPEMEQSNPKLKRGDFVRISKARQQFKKGYTASWSTEVYVVKNIK